MLTHQEARVLLQQHVETRNLRKHMYAVAAIMRHLAEHLPADPVVWELTGLLHDIDFEETKDDPARHAVRSAEILQGMLPEEALHAIRAHNHEYSGTPPATPLDYALIAADAMSGLVVATALVMPSRQLREVRVDSILKKYGDGSFARTIDRGRIRQCEQLGLSLEEFSHHALTALQGIHQDLGL
ncbi:MAG: HD domain-containing protein [Thermoplasmatota archaeon]